MRESLFVKQRERPRNVKLYARFDASFVRFKFRAVQRMVGPFIRKAAAKLREA